LSRFGGGGRILGGWLRGGRLDEVLYAVWLCCCWPEVLAGLVIGVFCSMCLQDTTYRKRQMVIFLVDALYQNGRKATLCSKVGEDKLMASKGKQASPC
jgi:hypothetical protein